MEWIYLESLLALALIVGIVWWTMAARHKPGERPAKERRSSDADSG